MRALLVPLALAATAVTSGSLALASIPGGDDDRESARPAPTTAVLSPRRLPEVLAATVGQTKLTAALDAALDSPATKGSTTCLTVEAGDDLVYARNPDASLVPASTMKVLTGMAALRRLGDDFRYVTPLVAPGGVPPSGVIEGQAWLVGSGDPLLSTAAYAATLRNQPAVFTSLDSLADSIVAAGVKEIRGGIVGDETRYDTVRYVASWKPVYLTDNDVGPVSALSVNDGFVSFRPQPRRHAADPAAHAASVLSDLLRGRGVVVGEPSSGRAPAGASTVASVASPPLPEVVGQLLRESDNMTAELLVKEMGVRFGGAGTWEAGLGVIRSTLQDAGLPVAAYQGVDGSGLDVSDRLSCTILMDALDLAGSGGAVAAGFPIAGQTGTLSDRFKGTPAEGKLRAKTGSLNFVAGLAGFVESAGAGTLEFALLANELPDRLQSGRQLQERVGSVLSQYPQVPPITELLPEPVAR
ncbi:MAG TPA: D-alanyl-D-alanine carboxypeptidase/D-alanyl-D-alanine-endopeptidase [Acidimicrobiales bacterium]|nr:D-alanyl-D-alanine carboxypeptidase/D-alanyl-D-alanine-endopeptidase [Acidimicrobiales bacterium]